MSRGSPRQLWLLPVLLITVIATALGALVARSVYADQPLPPAAVRPSTSSVPPSEQPGPPAVQGYADATAHPLYNTLHGLLQRYFDAINTKDYAAWSATVTTARRQAQPEEDWRTAYKTTRDGSITVYRIETAGADAAQVLLHFTSTQDPQDGPPEMPVGCIEWNVVWAFAKEKGEWRLAIGPSSASPQHTPCPT
ncbi:hypothetical protein [Actinophytocola sp.]|uniref:hypothetical protein n=1 Tax=Actinophytocola sp. TaxID=1872138 RepID=UPI00389B0782